MRPSVHSSSPSWRKRLRAAIDRTRKKHTFIAEEAGVNPASLSRILNERVNPSFESVVRVAHAAGETVGYLLGEQGYSLSAEDRAKLRDAAATIIQTTT